MSWYLAWCFATGVLAATASDPGGVSLLDAAAAGQLQTKQQVLAQAERLLSDVRSRDIVRFFHSQWLGIRTLDNLVRNEQYYPAFKPGMGALFRQETERLIEDVVFSGAGKPGSRPHHWQRTSVAATRSEGCGEPPRAPTANAFMSS